MRYTLLVIAVEDPVVQAVTVILAFRRETVVGWLVPLLSDGRAGALRPVPDEGLRACPLRVPRVAVAVLWLLKQALLRLYTSLDLREQRHGLLCLLSTCISFVTFIIAASAGCHKGWNSTSTGIKFDFDGSLVLNRVAIGRRVVS